MGNATREFVRLLAGLCEWLFNRLVLSTVCIGLLALFGFFSGMGTPSAGELISLCVVALLVVGVLGAVLGSLAEK